jgi:hypothetical protein
MAKISKSQLRANGKKITARAKSIRRANPGKKWTTCMKDAGKQLN